MKNDKLEKPYRDASAALSLSTFLLALALLCILALPDASFAKRQKVRNASGRAGCITVANIASQSCKSETFEEFFEALANCANEEEREDRNECKAEARADKREAREECRDIREARKELCRDLDEDFYDPEYSPANFLSPAATAANPNPYFPLVPGTVRVYQNAMDGETITVTVTSDTRVIDGVTTIIVNDVVTLDATGETIEDTDDYFAQHTNGDVWYFGEVAQEYVGGYLDSLDGSFIAGEDEAKPGILVKANPQVGDLQRQEFLLREAEDYSGVLSVTGTESVPGASCTNTCLVTEDGTPIEPDALENKYYAPGIGLILEVGLDDGSRTELISVTAP